MAEAADIRAGMEVVGSDGAPVGVVDRMDGPDQIRLQRGDGGGSGHVPLAMVTRVENRRVHLSVAGGAALTLANATLGGELPLVGDPVPAIHNRAVAGAGARRNFLLPWIVAAIGVVLLLLLLRSLVWHHPERTGAVVPATVAPLPVKAEALPDGTAAAPAAATLNDALQRYLASSEPTPRTFQFDTLNFATNSAAIRAEDRANVDALSRILAAYPHAVVKITGYADARGAAPANARLGQERADAVVAALAAKGIDTGRMTARSGGASDPTASNATPQGRFENRRSELTVTAK